MSNKGGQNMKAYKVVDKTTRRGSNFAIYTSVYGIEETKKAITKELSSYFPAYNKGDVVKCVEGSLGIFCFSNKKDALFFMKDHDIEDYCEIIEVKGFNLKTNTDEIRINVGCGCNFNRIIEEDGHKMRLYSGTLLFESIHIME